MVTVVGEQAGNNRNLPRVRDITPLKERRNERRRPRRRNTVPEIIEVVAGLLVRSAAGPRQSFMEGKISIDHRSDRVRPDQGGGGETSLPSCSTIKNDRCKRPLIDGIKAGKQFFRMERNFQPGGDSADQSGSNLLRIDSKGSVDGPC